MSFVLFHRSGQIIVAVVPKRVRTGFIRVAVVGVVLTMWRSPKQPKIATTALPMSHVVGFRIVEMKPSLKPDLWECDGKSDSYVVRPQAVVAILDHQEGPEKSEKHRERLAVFLTEESMEVVAGLHAIPDWWPQDPCTVSGLTRDLYLPHQGRPKKRPAPEETKVKETKNAQEENEIPPGEPGEMQKPDKKNSKKSNLKLKKVKTKLQIPALPQNFRKSMFGASLIRQEMAKLRDHDASIHPSSLLFRGEECLCHMKDEKANGVPWKHIVNNAFNYFKAQRLASGFLWLVLLLCDVFICFLYASIIFYNIIYVFKSLSAIHWHPPQVPQVTWS